MTTLKDLRDRVIADLDLYNEDFANKSDLDTWIREGVKIAEDSIHGLYQDYFLSYTDNIDVTSEYIPYPDDIYGNKIKSIIHVISGTAYEVKQSRSIKKSVMDEILNKADYTTVLEWYPINRAGTGRMIRLTPAGDLGGYLVIMYIRNAKVLINDDDVCDIDEFERVIIQHAKTQAYLKDGDPRAADSAVLETAYIKAMNDSLADMAADMDNEMEADFSHYEESV